MINKAKIWSGIGSVIITLGMLLCLDACLPKVLGSDLSRSKMGTVVDVKVGRLGRVNQERVIVLEGMVEDWNMKILSDKLHELAEVRRPAYMVIDSPGGSVSAGLNFINTLKSLKVQKRLKLVCVITDSAYSMAAFIAMYCAETYMLNSASMMFHQASYQVSGSAHEIRRMVSFTERYLNTIEMDLAKQMGMSYEDYLDFRGIEVWLTSLDAVNMGIVDGILTDFYYEAKAPERPQSNSFSIFRRYITDFIKLVGGE